MGLLTEGIGKDDERMLAGIHLGRQWIPSHVRTFQYQWKKLLRITLHAFIANSYICGTCSILIIIIRCKRSCLYFHFKQGMPFMFYRNKLNFRHRVKSCLYHFTDKISIGLWILQPYNYAVIIHSIEQTATVRIGKCRHGFKPRLHFLTLQHFLEIVSWAFRYQCIVMYLHSFLIVVWV